MSDEWIDRALCNDAPDPELWFPAGYVNSADVVKILDAQRICGHCPVAAECLAYAMRLERSKPADMRAGVYAGTTPHERYEMYRNRFKAVAS